MVKHWRYIFRLRIRKARTSLLVQFSFSLMFSLLLPKVGTAKGKYLPAPQWTGEYLQAREGGVFLRIQLREFQKSDRGRFINENVIIQLKSTNSARSYQFSQTVQSQGQPKFIWKLPQGNYQIERVNIIDNEGRNRFWKGPSKQTFRVEALSLSYFGNWQLKPANKNQLEIEFQVDEANYQHQFAHQTFAYVIHGINGQRLQSLGGAEVYKQSRDNFSTREEARAVFSTVRQISMVYQLNLGGANKYSKAIVRTLNSRDVELRNCYSEQLELNDSLSGSVRFRFQMSETNGVMERIGYSGGSLKNEQVIRCLYYKLGQLQFPIASKITGQITFQFSTK